MARISKFDNEHTEKSKQLAEVFKNESLKMTIEEINKLQERFGISNAQLSKILEIEEASISRWKNGKYNLPLYSKISIQALLKYLEENS